MTAQLAAVVGDLLTPRLIACVATSVGRRSILPLEAAVEVIQRSRTVGLVYHSPSDSETLRRIEEAPWSFMDLLEALGADHSYVLLANTTGAKSASDAVTAALAGQEVFPTLRAAALHDEPVIKLEVLDERRRPNDAEVLGALEALVGRWGMCVIPLVSVDIQVVRACAEFGAPAVRLLSGEIGAGTGIHSAESVAEVIAASPVPVVLEGGLSTAQHVREAIAVGASAVLVNGAFHRHPAPGGLAAELRAAVVGDAEATGERIGQTADSAHR